MGKHKRKVIDIASTLISLLPWICLVHAGSPEIECNRNLRGIGSLGRNHFYISSVKLSWHDANDTCRTYKNTYLALGSDEETIQFLFKHKSGSQNWLGAYDLKFNNWTWLNDQMFNGEMRDYSEGHVKSTCGVVNPGNTTHLGQSACYIERRYLCVKSDANTTSLNRDDYYIATKTENSTWFQARSSCLCRGMDLATANGNATDYMYTLLNGTSELFWIGLQKTRFVSAKTGKMIDHMPFQEKQPNHWTSAEDCVTMWETGYNDADCADELIFFCMWENITADPGESLRHSQSHSEPRKRMAGHSTAVQSSMDTGTRVLSEVGDSSPEINCNQNFRWLGSLGRRHFYVSNVPLSWHDANDTCRTYKNTYLASVPDKETRQLLLQHLNSRHWLRAHENPHLAFFDEEIRQRLLQHSNPIHWFGAHELKFHSWMWLNDEPFYGEMVDHTKEHIKSTCGLVNPANLTGLGQSACYITRRFLCVHSDANVSSLRRDDYYISTKTEYSTWFQARSSCLCRGMDLAIAKGNSTEFMYTLLNGTLETFWIGLQKTRYVYEKTGEIIDYMPFANNEPNDWESSEDCVEMNRDRYNDNNCTKELAFFCMWENTTAAPVETAKHPPLNFTLESSTKSSLHLDNRSDSGDSTSQTPLTDGVQYGSPEIECNKNFRHLGNLGQTHFYVSSTKSSWHDANDTCRAYQNTYLASVPDEETRQLLFKEVDHGTLCWFGAHELKFHNWMWLTDQVFCGDMTDYSPEHVKSTCGVLNPDELNRLGQSACYTKKRFLCVKPDADIGSLTKDDFYISTKTEYHTWFQARSICRCRGMDLATAIGNTTDYMYTLLNGASDPIWIGLQKTRYVFEKSGKIIDYMPFGNNEPNDWESSEDCVEMNRGRYNDNSCSKKMVFFCMWENTTVEPGEISQYPPPFSGPGSCPSVSTTELFSTPESLGDSTIVVHRDTETSTSLPTSETTADSSKASYNRADADTSQSHSPDKTLEAKSTKGHNGGVVTAAVVGTVVAVIAVVVVTLVVLKLKARSLGTHGGGLWRFSAMKEDIDEMDILPRK